MNETLRYQQPSEEDFSVFLVFLLNSGVMVLEHFNK